MRTIKGMILKDLNVLIKNRMFIIWNIVIVVFAIIGGICSEKVLWLSSMYTILGTYYFSMILMWHDDNKGIYLSSLPVTRSYIVMSKYLVLIAYNLSVTIFQIVVVEVIGAVFLRNSINFEVSIFVISIVMLLSIILISMFIPIYVKFGYNKNAGMVVILSITLLPAIIKKSFTPKQLYEVVEGLQKIFFNISVSSILFFIISIAVCIISAKISTCIYKNKEF